MDYLDRVLSTPELMAPGVRVRRLRKGEYAILAPGMAAEGRVTTDPAYYEEHADSLDRLDLQLDRNPRVVFVSGQEIAIAARKELG